MAGKPRGFVSRLIPEAGLARIRQQCEPDVRPAPLRPPYGVVRPKAAGSDGLVSPSADRIDPALMDAAPRLKVISNYAVGFNNVDVKAATERGICVGNPPGVLTDATADM